MTFRSECCEGERCFCGAPADYKVGEEIMPDDPVPHRHNLTAYICGPHFRQIMGPIVPYPLPTSAGEWRGDEPPTEPWSKILAWCTFPAGAEVRLVQRDRLNRWIFAGFAQTFKLWRNLPSPPQAEG